MSDWHHSPLHRTGDAGTYCVTAATLYKEQVFRTAADLDMLVEEFHRFMNRWQWSPESWSFFPNHYHFIAASPTVIEKPLGSLLSDFHSATARQINQKSGSPGRQVWFQYWDTKLTIAGSYLARLRYVTENAVHHGIVSRAENYRWSSASWFADHAPSSLRRAVASIKTDRVNIIDFDV